MDTRWEVKHFRLFFVFLAAGLVDLDSKSLDFSNAPDTEKHTDNLRWSLDLGSTSLEQSLRLKTLGYLPFIPAIFSICCLAAQWPTFDCYQGNSLIHPMLITVSGLPLFGPKVTGRDWVSICN